MAWGLLALVAPAPAQAAASGWGKHEFARARLVSAVAAVGDLQELRLGLQIKLEPGWWTYWRSPGDAGLPVQVDWSGSENLAEATLLWPAPERHTLLGIETFGYQGEVLLPVLARPRKPGEPVKLRAAVDYLVCEKICVPAHAELALDLPAGSAVASPLVDLVDRWRAKVPGDGKAAGLTVERVSLLRDGAGASLAVRVAAREPLVAPELIVEGPTGLRFAKPRANLESGGNAATLVSAIATDKVSPDAVLAGGITLTLIDGARAIEVKTPVVPGSAADLGGGDLAVLGGVLLVALLGGLILNLMPCVLPVLSLKMMSVVGHGGGDRRAVRFGFIAAAAGILSSFLLLAGGAIALRSAGLAVGWGIQFQQPAFIAAMAAILVLFACNMMGWFELSGPRWAFDAAETRAASHGMLGHFLTGALATLMATPCSAPFLGAAIGFALSRGAFEIMAVFLALGIGLSLPYLLVAAFPGLATRLPRPGRWMLHLRRALGAALALTALWLVGVLAAQRGAAAAAVVAALLVVLTLGFAFANRLPAAIRRAAPAAVAAYVLATVAIATLLPGAGAGDASVASKDDHWRRFDEAAIPALVAEGRVVFVDVTADWCITCQANKTLVLKRGEVAQRLGGGEIVGMRADWTRPDPAIARYLTKFGRYGIPFNVVYGPNAPQGIALPELLTSEAVLAAFDQAHAAARPVAKRP